MLIGGEDLVIEWISNNASKYMPVTPSEVVDIGFEIYERFIHPDTIRDIFPHFMEFYKVGDDREIMTEFQDFLIYEKYWTKLFTSTMISKEHKSLITITIPINDVAQNIWLAKEIKDDPFVRKNFEKYEQLTAREKEVLKLIAVGNTNRQIADQLMISHHTVRTHRNRIFNKLNIKTVAEATHYAHSFNLT